MRSKATHERPSRGQWFKSTYSGSHGECVEVADLTGRIGMRDTQNRELGALLFGTDEWEAFLGTARDDLR